MALALLVLLAGCSHLEKFGQRCPNGSTHEQPDRPCPTDAEAATYADETSRGMQWVSTLSWTRGPDGTWSEGRKLGVALSGGGSKASPIAMGVIAGLADVDLLLPKGPGAVPEDVAVSSVSGGGYAAFHLFSQLAWHSQLPRNESPSDTLRRMYWDCLEEAPGYLHDDLKMALANGKVLCNTSFPENQEQSKAVSPPRQERKQLRKVPQTREVLNAEQFKVKCGQDLMQPGECSLGGDASTTVWSVANLLVPTFLSLPAHHFFNTVFDSGVSVTPSRHTYKHGIGLTYGSVANRMSGAQAQPLRGGYLNCLGGANDETGRIKGNFRPDATRCEVVSLSPHHDNILPIGEQHPFYLQADDLDFKQLRDLRAAGRESKAPLWIIQATAPEYRSLWGWFANPERNIASDTFEITPYRYGSLRYGFMQGAPTELSVLEATTAAAAFFDSSQQSVTKGRSEAVIGVLLHGLNLNWGHDIPNYNVSGLRQTVHRALPFPLYWMDSAASQLLADTAERSKIRSAFIRLNDGGNSDNTGAYSLIRRGVPVVVIADAAEDGDGTFGDLCNLSKALRSGTNVVPLYFTIPGLEGFDNDCGDHRAYDLSREWGHAAPVLVGCVGPDPSNPCRAPLDGAAGKVTRLIIIKPRVEWNQAMVRNAIRTHGRVGQCVQDGKLWQVGSAPEGGDAFTRALRWQAAGKVQRQVAVSCMQDVGASPESLRSCALATPCSVARFFLADPGLRPHSPWNSFPQNPTVLTTLNSGPALFTASRDLARHYTHLAQHLIRDALGTGEQVFHPAVRQQCDNPVKPLQDLRNAGSPVRDDERPGSSWATLSTKSSVQACAAL